MSLRTFTRLELSLYNGKNGARSFVACRGQVFDVTGSYFWKGGRHWSTHNAGEDLTEDFRQAPHGFELLQRYPLIGTLVEEPV